MKNGEKHLEKIMSSPLDLESKIESLTNVWENSHLFDWANKDKEWGAFTELIDSIETDDISIRYEILNLLGEIYGTGSRSCRNGAICSCCGEEAMVDLPYDCGCCSAVLCYQCAIGHMQDYGSGAL